MDSEIELRHLRYFVAVAEELHFGRAAQRLHLAQPPLSQQIRRLEELLGHPLFLRTSRSVALTAAGELLLERARRTLRGVERDLQETRNVGSGEVGSLHAGFVGSAMLTTLPAVFRDYRAAYPRVRLQLHESFTSQVIQGLENGSLDVGVLRDSGPVEGMVITPLIREPFVAVLPAVHRCARQKSMSAAELRGEPFVLYPRSAGVRAFELTLSLCEVHGFRPEIAQPEASHWLTIVRLVGAGMGVSIAPACVHRVGGEDVAFVALRGTGARSEIQIASRAGDARPLVRQFLAMAASVSAAGRVRPKRGRDARRQEAAPHLRKARRTPREDSAPVTVTYSVMT